MSYYDDLLEQRAVVLDAAARWQTAPAPKKPAARQTFNASRQQRMYASAKRSRLTVGFGGATNASADSELSLGLAELRSRSRQLIRDASYAKKAKLTVVNNVIGEGIGLQAQVKNRQNNQETRINAAIEREWLEWCRAENCHTGGRLHFSDLERMLMGQVFEAGEIFVRKYPRKFGHSRVPLALEIVEPERLAEEYTQAVVAAGSICKLGVEMDEFGRPLRFWMRKIHPAEVRSTLLAQSTDYLYPVPADQIYHLACVDRWPQTRGEPWLHTAARRLNDMDGYSEAEIVAARGAASYMGIRKPAMPEDGAVGEEAPPEFDLEPGAVETLQPGEEFEFVSPNRPNPNMDPFMRMMLREVAMGARTSYEAISGDYSQSNLSSSRMGQQDSRDDYRVLQRWFIRSFREELHREWLMAAVIAGAIPEIDLAAYANDPHKFEAVAFKARGWSYINPKEDVEASERAIRAGLSTRTHEIAKYGDGRDREDVDEMREQENEAARAKDLVYTTDPTEFDNAGKHHQAPETPAEPSAPTEPAAREGTIHHMRASNA
jgi:lambda family phage portal protein